MGIDRPVIRVSAQRVIDNLTARDQSAAPLHKETEKLEFRRGKLEGGRTNVGAECARIHANAAKGHVTAVRKTSPSPSEHNFCPGNKLEWIDRFNYVIIAPKPEAGQFVYVFAKSAGDNDRHLTRSRPKVREYRKSVAAGQPQVENDQFRSPPSREVQRLHAITRDEAFGPLSSKERVDDLGDLGLVLDNERAHTAQACAGLGRLIGTHCAEPLASSARRRIISLH